MLIITELPLSPGAEVRRKYFVCKRCGVKNWFSYGRPLVCQNATCGAEFYNIEGLMDRKERTMKHFYEKGII